MEHVVGFYYYESQFKRFMKAIFHFYSVQENRISDLSERFPKQTLVFTCLLLQSFENTVRQGEIARNEQFLLFPQCFLPVWRALCHFHQILNCCLQTLSVWKTLRFVVWAMVNCFPNNPWF